MIGIDYRQIPSGFTFNVPGVTAFQPHLYNGRTDSNAIRTDSYFPRVTGKGISKTDIRAVGGQPRVNCFANNEVFLNSGRNIRGQVPIRWSFLMEVNEPFWDIIDHPITGLHNTQTATAAGLPFTTPFSDWFNFGQIKDFAEPTVAAFFVKAAPNNFVHCRLQTTTSPGVPAYVSNGLMAPRGDGRRYLCELRFKLDPATDNVYPGEADGYFYVTVNGHLINMVDRAATIDPSWIATLNNPSLNPYTNYGIARGFYMWNYIGKRLGPFSSPITQVPHNIIVDHDPGFFLNHQQCILRFQGSNGSSVIVDSSKHLHTLTASSGAVLSNAQVRFPSATKTTSLYVPNGGSLRFDVGREAELSFGTGDFTFETWVMFESLPSQDQFIIDTRGSAVASPARIIIYADASNFMNFSTGTTPGGLSAAAPTPLVPMQWYHVAISRSGTTTRCFLNGQLAHTQTGDSRDYQVDPGRPILGSFRTGTSGHLLGWLDAARWTKGACRYTGPFTPPEFP